MIFFRRFFKKGVLDGTGTLLPMALSRSLARSSADPEGKIGGMKKFYKKNDLAKALFRFRIDGDECFDKGPEQCLAA